MSGQGQMPKSPKSKKMTEKTFSKKKKSITAPENEGIIWAP